jgi:hypothetical protein
LLKKHVPTSDILVENYAKNVIGSKTKFCYFTPDIIIRISQSKNIILLITHTSTKRTANIKFWESVEELYELKLFSEEHSQKNMVCLCLFSTKALDEDFPNYYLTTFKVLFDEFLEFHIDKTVQSTLLDLATKIERRCGYKFNSKTPKTNIVCKKFLEYLDKTTNYLIKNYLEEQRIKLKKIIQCYKSRKLNLKHTTFWKRMFNITNKTKLITNQEIPKSSKIIEIIDLILPLNEKEISLIESYNQPLHTEVPLILTKLGYMRTKTTGKGKVSFVLAKRGEALKRMKDENLYLMVKEHFLKLLNKERSIREIHLQARYGKELWLLRCLELRNIMEKLNELFQDSTNINESSVKKVFSSVHIKISTIKFFFNKFNNSKIEIDFENSGLKLSQFCDYLNSYSINDWYEDILVWGTGKKRDFCKKLSIVEKYKLLRNLTKSDGQIATNIMKYSFPKKVRQVFQGSRHFLKVLLGTTLKEIATKIQYLYKVETKVLKEKKKTLVNYILSTKGIQLKKNQGTVGVLTLHVKYSDRGIAEYLFLSMNWFDHLPIFISGEARGLLTKYTLKGIELNKNIKGIFFLTDQTWRKKWNIRRINRVRSSMIKLYFVSEIEKMKQEILDDIYRLCREHVLNAK